MDSALSRCACRLILILIAFILLLRGVSIASDRPADNRRLFVRADVITGDAETSDELIAAPLSDALENSGFFSSLAAMSEAGAFHLTARLNSTTSSSFSTDDAARLIYPYLGSWLSGPAPYISVSHGYADFPAAYLLFRKPEDETTLQFSRSVTGYLEALFAGVRECGELRLFGGAAEELTITVDPARSAEYGIDISRMHRLIASMLSGGTAAGILESDSIALPVFITPDISSLEELGAFPVPAAAGFTVPLRELAGISLDISCPDGSAMTPEGEAAMIAEISTLSSGDIGFYHALTRERDKQADSFRLAQLPSAAIIRSVQVLRFFPLGLLPLCLILLLYPEKNRSAAALEMELVLILIIILLEGIITPRSVMIILLVIPLGPAAAFCFGTGNNRCLPFGALLFVQVLLFPLRNSELLLMVCSLVSALLAGISAKRIIEDGPLFGVIGKSASAMLLTAAILILSPPFLTSLNAGPLYPVHSRESTGVSLPRGETWSFVSTDARFLQEYPGIVPPGTVTSFLPPGISKKPFPRRIGGERMRIEIREDSPAPKEEGVALLSGFLEYRGHRFLAGKLPPDDRNGIPVYLAVLQPGDPGSFPVNISGKTLLLSSLAEFKTVREALYIRRWSGSR